MTEPPDPRTSSKRKTLDFATWSVLGLFWAAQGILYGSVTGQKLVLNALGCLLTPVLLWQSTELGTRRRAVALILSAVVLGLLAFKICHALGLS